MKFGSMKITAIGLLLSAVSNYGFAEDNHQTSRALRADKTYSLALIDGMRVEGGALLGLYLNSETLLEASYLEEKNLAIVDSHSSEYNSRSKSFDLGAKRFFGNSFFTSLVVRHMETESNNNNYSDPQITLWHNDIMARLAIGNQWQFIEGMSLGVEWLNLGTTVHRINHSSHNSRLSDSAQASNDEKKANRFFYSALNFQLGYSF